MEILKWIHDFNTSLGINVTLTYDPFDQNRFVNGIITTIELTALSLVFGLLIGIVGAWAQGARSRIIRYSMSSYIQLFRNTPSLIQLYFFYFGVGSYLTAVSSDGINAPIISGFTWAVLCFSIYSGAFNTEILRAGIEAVPRSTLEAAESLGYTRLGAYLHVILPLAFRISLPAMTNNFVNLAKQTSVAYAIGVPELLYVSSQIWADSLNVPEMMNVMLLTYVTLVGLLVLAMTRLERALRVPGIGT